MDAGINDKLCTTVDSENIQPKLDQLVFMLFCTMKMNDELWFGIAVEKIIRVNHIATSYSMENVSGLLRVCL